MNLFGIGVALAETAATTAAEGEAVQETGMGAMLLGTLLPMVLIFGLMYVVMIRPQRKKDKQVKDMLANLKVSDRICTIGGIYGTITAIRDDTITLTVGNQNMTMVVARWAIRSVEEVAIENDAEALN